MNITLTICAVIGVVFLGIIALSVTDYIGEQREHDSRSNQRALYNYILNN